MASNKLQPAVFLDRDGTLIEEVGYIDSLEKIKLIPQSEKAVILLKNGGYKTIIISNQSGVARGYFTEETVRHINNNILELFSGKGATIDAIYYCPHHPEFGGKNYKKDCECRKPKPGMILRAANEHNIDLSKSIIVGDKFTDIKTGKDLNLFSILVLTGFGRGEYERMKTHALKPAPDFVTENIYRAALYIKKNLDQV